MKVHDMNGNEFDITREEAERISEHLHKLDGNHESNEAFTNRALDHIFELTGEHPANEDDLKKLLYNRIPNTSWQTIDLLSEAMDVLVGWHKKNVG